VEYIENHLEESRPRWLGHLGRMDETNLLKRVPRYMNRGRPKKSWDEMVKEDMNKRSLCINDAKDKNNRRKQAQQAYIFILISLYDNKVL